MIAVEPPLLQKAVTVEFVHEKRRVANDDKRAFEFISTLFPSQRK